jgi:hypothetical protein
VEAPGGMGSWAVHDDRREVLGLARCEAPQDSEYSRVIVSPAKDDELWFRLVPFEITLLANGKLDGCIKWHPPFISRRDGAGELNLVTPVALAGEGIGGLLT